MYAYDDDELDVRGDLRGERVRAIAIGAAILAAIAGVIGYSAIAGTESRGATVTQKASATAVVTVIGTHRSERAVATPGAPAELARWTGGGTPPVVAVRGVRVVASSRPDVGSAARAAADRIDVLDGLLVLRNASFQASTTRSRDTVTGAATLASGATLVVNGTPRPAKAGMVVSLEGVGTVTIGESARTGGAPAGDATAGPRERVTGALLHVRLTSAVGGLPRGTSIVVGRVDTLTRVIPAQLPAATPSDPDSEYSAPRRSASVRAAANPATGNMQGYTFPVLGATASDYANTWGAPRASTGRHEGTDIFAQRGTPLVAVADGTLNRVGWNPIGGNRLWLEDQFGNAFYYAHLSAFSLTAVEGGFVRAGDVIGFVGDTGDAMGTPPHLHFEVHPGGGAAVNPYPFLVSWQSGRAVPIAVARIAVPGSWLVGGSDITTVSGAEGDGPFAALRAHRAIEHEGTHVPARDSLEAALENDPLLPADQAP